MKRIKPLLFLSLSFIALMSVTSEAYAAPTTDGVVEFTEGGGEDTGPIKVIKPGTEKELITINENLGSRTTGGLSFSFVPNLDFGQAELSVTDQTYYAKPIPYKLSDPAASQTTQYLPPFLQVVNESGQDKKFAVYAWATKFKGDSGHELTNTRIKLTNFSARNTALDAGTKGGADEGYGNVDAVGANYLTVPDLTNLPDQSLTIPTKQSDAPLIFASASGNRTRGNASSVVFQENYGPKTPYLEKDSFTSVKLEVPASDQPKKEGYTAVITWELEDTMR